MESSERGPLAKIFSWNLMLVCGVLVYGSHGVLLNLCKVDGKIPFNSMSVVLLIEFSKLLMSVLMFLPEAMNNSVVRVPSPKEFFMFSVPAILYSINNNIVVHIQTFVDPASFQVLSNLKIVCTAIFYKIFLNRHVSKSKWVAFIMITVAGGFNSYGGWVSNQKISEDSVKTVHVRLFGIILILMYCCISGAAGVYTEYVLKKQAKLSLSVQSIMLYSFGVGINFSAFFMSQVFSLQNYKDFQGTDDLLKGYSIWTLIIIFTQAVNGIITGVIMKHASSLTRLILVAGAMLVSTTLSVIIFGLQFNSYFAVAFVLVITAMYIYH